MDANQFKKNIETTFDDVSSRYDENKFFAISASRMVELVPSWEKMNVLDISTGTGVVAIEMARKYRHADIEGIDLSLGMLKQAIYKAQEEGLENVTFKQCDIESIPYADAVFDIVTCGYALFFYPDMEAAYQAICKTVKSGGVFVFSSFTNEAFNPYAELFLQRLEADYKIEAPSRLRERLKTVKQIEELAVLSKHKRIDVEYHPIRYSITISEWWSLLNTTGYKSLIDQLTDVQLTQFKQEHLWEIETISVDGVIELNVDTIFGVVHV
ncbi:MAG: methyltransferase domain-containing protein [gamma proteobacterium endosymbiont of Lamellibrachia anaximandri]|nr:methyltransferase domain-containing protein [gamma proteobacterium endosymbiont of Lamellibrachia anaximandri]MBL3618934.1 methyltransferase domain-containing protein [gamma proteobacterium endosymbiont of Lamellibrachia anaximandri]